jgi:hypothetical protein
VLQLTLAWQKLASDTACSGSATTEGSAIGTQFIYRIWPALSNDLAFQNAHLGVHGRSAGD